VNDRGQYGERPPEPRYAALRRAVKAIFYLHDRAHAPLYVYAEVNGIVTARPAQTAEEAAAIFAEFERSPGEVYVASFAVSSPYWPDPDYSVYHAPPPTRADHPSVVGASLLHVLELKQRYENATAAPVQALLNGIAQDGTISSLGPNHWEVALREGAWVRIFWDADFRILTVTITDKGTHPGTQSPAIRSWYESILARLVTPRLTNYGAIAVGGYHDRGSYGRGAVVGRLYHSVGDREDAVKQMDLDWTALFQDLAVQAGELTRDPSSSSGYHLTTQAEFDAMKPDPKKVTWWKSYAKPRFKEWVKFRSDQLGQDATVAPNYLAWTERFQTNWSVYEEWKDKLDALRTAAQQAGFTVGAPTAAPLPTTVWQEAGGVVQKGASAVATGVGDVWSLLKYGAWAVLGIGAIVAVSSVASNLRSGKDPAEKYVELIRERRRAAPRALPASSRLALPPGEAEMVPA